LHYAKQTDQFYLLTFSVITVVCAQDQNNDAIK